MADKITTGASDQQDIPQKWVDQSDGTWALKVAASVSAGATTIADGGDVAQGSTGDAAWVSGAGTVIALLKKIAGSAGGGTQYIEDAASTGGELMNLSGTVRQDTPAGTTSTDGDYQNLKTDSIGRLWTQVGASALPAGASTSAKQPAIGTAGSASVDVITVQGIASGTAQTVSGTVTTTPPANASTNMAQVAGTTTDTNSGTKSAGTQRVVLATDQPALTNPLKVDGSGVTQPVSGTVTITPSGTQTTKEVRSATPAQTSVAGSASSVSLLASNANRLGATVFNDSSAILYLKLGATASTTSHSVQMIAASYYEVPFAYTGAIDGIWASATGNARITELS